MKKSLLFLTLTILGFAQVLGYKITVKNNLKLSPIQVTLDKNWCSSEYKLIAANDKYEFDTGACCLGSIIVQNYWSGKSKELATSGGGCRNYTLIASPAPGVTSDLQGDEGFELYWKK